MSIQIFVGGNMRVPICADMIIALFSLPRSAHTYTLLTSNGKANEQSVEL